MKEALISFQLIRINRPVADQLGAVILDDYGLGLVDSRMACANSRLNSAVSLLRVAAIASGCPRGELPP